MSDWSDGYVTDIGYTFGYYPELNPLRVPLALLSAGLLPPKIVNACELGFGQGVSLNMHAAAGVRWWGTDFNPAHAGFARRLARASRAEVQAFDQSFAEFCRRDDLPDFEYIGLHGIWSWISDENRALIVDFVRRKLAVGGVLYISYNCWPGWAPLMPLRHLLNEHAEQMGAPGQGVLGRVEASLAFADKFFETKPRYAIANPAAQLRFNKMKEQNRRYLAHEYFNSDWHPMPFSRMAEWLQPAKLEFATSAHPTDTVDSLNFTEAQLALMRDIPSTHFRETVRDYMGNQQFRRDYWVKGGCRLSGLEQGEMMRELRFVLTRRVQDVLLKVSGMLGDASLQEASCRPVLDALADQQPKSLAQIVTAIAAHNISTPRLLQTITALLGNGALAPALADADIAAAKKPTDRLNAALMGLARGNAEVQYLASPVTGGGVQVARFDQLFLLARRLGAARPEQWAAEAWKPLAAQNQRIMKDGKPLSTAEECLAELTVQAHSFAEERLPALTALGIA